MPGYQSLYRLLMALSGIVLLSGCGSHYVHVVEKGETLYSIGWAYGKDYRDIARWNGIAAPYNLQPGQRLRIVPPMEDGVEPSAAAIVTTKEEGAETNAETNQGNHAAPVSPPVASSDDAGSSPARAMTARVVEATKTFFTTGSLDAKDNGKTLADNAKPDWQWPANGRLLQTFDADDPRRQGVDITAEMGNPINAAASGKVVYAGSGLQRYGKLIIVKHNETFLSAYAHNSKLRVREGEEVRAGQHIADMGDSGAKQSMLHFEIRENGKPVNPLRYLPKRRN